MVFGKIIKKVGQFGRNIVKKVGPFLSTGLRAFSTIAPELGNISNKLGQVYNNPSLGKSIQHGIDLAGRTSMIGSMVTHRGLYGDMRMPG